MNTNELISLFLPPIIDDINWLEDRIYFLALDLGVNLDDEEMETPGSSARESKESR